MTARLTRSFLGGLRWQGGFALWPLVRLTITPRSVQLRPVAGFLRHVVPGRELNLDLIAGAERIVSVGPFPAPGVRLWQRDEPPLIFWTLRPQRTLTALERAGIEVSPDSRSAPFWGTG
jgi:hypothetical protein